MEQMQEIAAFEQNLSELNAHTLRRAKAHGLFGCAVGTRDE
ncbi:MAG: hypothetical protein R2911_31270 [Caldilineaceae bacterium]